MGAVPRPESWRGKRVLVTGHSGFVGGWLSAWLLKLGARVSGFALPPPTNPSFFVLTALGQRLAASITGDLRDAAAVAAAVRGARPQIVFHLAAQPLVRDAWRDPVGTFGSNLMGTVHLLEACRGCAGLEKLVLYTTDKVYGDDPSGRGFCEQDPLGGSEPYSASKTGAEWAVCAYWESYFRRAAPPLAVAKVRAGNILGGGDWARERLLPDAVRAFSEGRPLVVRSPASTRPWQHVLDVVRGTLVLAERLEARDIAGDAIEQRKRDGGHVLFLSDRGDEQPHQLQCHGIASGPFGQHHDGLDRGDSHGGGRIECHAERHEQRGNRHGHAHFDNQSPATGHHEFDDCKRDRPEGSAPLATTRDVDGWKCVWFSRGQRCRMPGTVPKVPTQDSTRTPPQRGGRSSRVAPSLWKKRRSMEPMASIPWGPA